MRLLHVGWGYRPLRYGGVIVYVEDLLRALARRGHEVHYFCAGRGDFALRPRICEWSRDGIRFHELRNPPAPVAPYRGTRYPGFDVDHAGVRELFRGVLRRVRPDAVHIQEFYGLPARIIEDVKNAGIRLVVTLEDLSCLCPTLVLYKAETGENCVDYEGGHGCVTCCRNAPAFSKVAHLKSGAWHALRPLRENAPAVYGAVRAGGHKALGLLPLARAASSSNGHPSNGDGSLAAVFDFRRREFVRLLETADVLHTVSTAVRDIHSAHGVKSDRFVPAETVVAAADTIRRTTRAPRAPLVAGFRGLFTRGKGSEVLLEAFREIPPSLATLRIDGFLDPAMASAVAEAERAGRACYMGSYSRERLQSILDATDIGVVPSVWREGHPLVSLEFLAAGIPVIGTTIGGIPEMVMDGRNGLLVAPGDARALRNAIVEFARDPQRIVRMRESMPPVKSMDQHVTEIEAFYRCESQPSS